MTPSGQAGGGAGGGAPSSAGANGSTVRSAALVTLGVVIGLAVVAVMAIARSDPAARGVPTTFRQHGSANDRTMLRPGGDASNLDAARVDRAGRAPTADGASEQESSQAGGADDSPVPPVVTVSYADTYLGSGIPGGGTVKQVNVTTGVPVNRRAGGWMVEHGEAQSPFDIQRAEYIPYPHAEMVIVTGASENHARATSCLVRSIRRLHPSEETHPIIFYDLGVSPESLALLEALPMEVRKFEYEKHPKFWDINVEAGHYGWKPQIVLDVLKESLTVTLWLDGGCIMRDRFDKLVKFTRKRGMYVAGQPSTQPVRSFTYKTVPKFFANLPPDSPIRQDAPAFQYNPKWKGAAGGFACFDPFSVYARTIAAAWQACAVQRECLAPEGSSRANHRQDQAALSLLVNWKYPDFWRYKHEVKKPVRFHRDHKKCKLGEGGFTFVPSKHHPS